MDQTSSSSARLEYATPPAPGQGGEFVDGDELVFDLGPMPDSVLVAELAPTTVAMAGCAWAIFLLMREHGVAIQALIMLGIAGVVCVINVAWFARYRHAPRMVAVSGGELRYSSAATGGRVAPVSLEIFRRIRVRRSWWRPWVCTLEAHAVISFLSARSTPPPHTLLVDTDRRRLQHIAAALRRALKLDDAHPN